MSETKKLSLEDYNKLRSLAADADTKIAEANLAIANRDKFVNVELPEKYGIDGAFNVGPQREIVAVQSD